MSDRVRGGNQPLRKFEQALGFPPDFTIRSPQSPSVYAKDATDWLEHERPTSQNFWPALVLSFIGQAEELLESINATSIAHVFDIYPPEAGTAGRPKHTLNFTQPTGGQPVRLRKRYERVVEVIRVPMLREHPSAAPHATQAWPAYTPLIDLIFRMSPQDRLTLAEYVWDKGVLEAPQATIAEVRARVVRPFEYVLANMPTRGVPNVRGGALLQAISYGYLRADSPNLILESYKVNVGGSRAALIGDVAGFRGSEPELAAEVKDMDIGIGDVDTTLGDFLEDVTEAPNATAVVICREISDDARAHLESRNLTALSLNDLVRIVGVWDLPKQQEALRGVDYYLGRIQKSHAAQTYFRTWIGEHGLDSGLSAPTVMTIDLSSQAPDKAN